MRILVVEDEAELREAVARRLRGSGFAVDEASDLDEAQRNLAVYEYDCLVLDRILPSGDSLEHLSGWREGGYQGTALFLTARDTVEDRVQGFESGGDDYLVKPFAMEELVARVRSLCRRKADTGPSLLQIGNLELDLGRREVRRGGILLTLTGKEFAILELLASQAGVVVSRSDIIEHCWDELHDPMSNVEEVHVAGLRRKLGKPNLIRTVRGAGYMLEEEVEDA